MVQKVEYDFLDFISFPSSLKIRNSALTRTGRLLQLTFPVKPGDKVVVKVMAKQENVSPQSRNSLIDFNMLINGEWRYWMGLGLPAGSFGWSPFEITGVAPAGITRFMLRGVWGGGSGDDARPAVTHFDDLKIYHNDKLIYENKFSNWLPYQIAGAVITAIPIGLYAARRMPKITVPQEWWK